VTLLTALTSALASAVLLSGCGGSLTDGGNVNALTTPVSQPGVPTVATIQPAGSPGQPMAQAAVASGGTSKVADRAVDKTGAVAAANGKERPLGANATKVAETLTAAATPGNNAYKIGALDVLDISVFKAPELSKSVQVADTGTVNLPLIEDVQVVGRTAQEIERDIAGRLGAKYLQKPQVTVYVKEYNSQRVTVEGAVKKPGVFPVRGGNTLLQYLAMAEGLDPNSDSTVLVFRTTNGVRSAAKFDVSEIRAGTAKDPTLFSGDVVVAPSSTMKEVFNNFIKVLPLASVFAVL
jgi:polysaccharide biosynthesis/export protein